jgi:hypothetical protein
MTYPTIREMDEMDKAQPQTKAALEFIWTFTEWWEKLECGLEELPGDLDVLMAMEKAYERWRNLR